MMIKNFRKPSFSPINFFENSNASTPLSIIENITPKRKKTNKSLNSITLQKSTPESSHVTRSCPNIAFLADIFDTLYQRQTAPEGLADIIQSGNKPSLRYRLVEWIAKLCKFFNLRRGVMYSAVNIIDKAMHSVTISKNKMQLYGATAFWLSVKFHCPKNVSLSQVLSEIGDHYSKEDVIQCESIILEALNYNINIPNTGDFINLLEENLSCDRPLIILLWTLSDVSLQFSGFLRFKPSTIATAILIYSLNCLKRTFENEIVRKMLSIEDPKKLFNCIEEINNLVLDLKNKRKKSIIEETSNGSYNQSKKWLSRAALPDIGSFLSLFPEENFF